MDGGGDQADGDRAAAMRYTEAKLEKLALELLVEIPKKKPPGLLRELSDGSVSI